MACTRMSWMLLSYLLVLSLVQGKSIQQKQKSTRNSYVKASSINGAYSYALFMTPKSWMDANIACQKWNSGHLASLHSETEASFVASLVKDQLNNGNFTWIGLFDPTEGQSPHGEGWEWSNNDVMNYRAWEKEPPTLPHFGYCGSLIGKTGYRYWKDYNCQLLFPYVCKFKN